MLKFTEFREESESNPHDTIPLSQMPPALINLQRVSVRQFQNGTNVALYYSKTINRFFTILYR